MFVRGIYAHQGGRGTSSVEIFWLFIPHPRASRTPHCRCTTCVTQTCPSANGSTWAEETYGNHSYEWWADVNGSIAPVRFTHGPQARPEITPCPICCSLGLSGNCCSETYCFGTYIPTSPSLISPAAFPTNKLERSHLCSDACAVFWDCFGT